MFKLGNEKQHFPLLSLKRDNVISPRFLLSTEKVTPKDVGVERVSFHTFDIELGELQLFLVVPKEEMKVLPGDKLLVLEASRLQHGQYSLVRLALRQSAIGDFNERPAMYRERERDTERERETGSKRVRESKTKILQLVVHCYCTGRSVGTTHTPT